MKPTKKTAKKKDEPKPEYQPFARRLREARMAAGILAQRQLARRVGVADQTANRWETARNMPDPQQIVEISRVLNVSSEYLLTGNTNGEVEMGDSLASYLRSEGKHLNSDQRRGLALLLGRDSDVSAYRIQAALDLLLPKGGNKDA